MGDRARPALGCQWIVKQPNERAAQEDLPNPLDAQTQYEALSTLAAHFEPVEPVLRVPRPVALLPEVGAFAMERARGIGVDRMAGPRALRDPAALLNGVDLSGRFLRRLHSLEPARSGIASPRALAEEILEFAEQSLRPAGLVLPAELAEALEAVRTARVRTSLVRLHGDFAPVNMIVERGAFVTGIDPSLTEVGIPESDLARFLMMLETERLFLLGGALPRVRALRAEAEAVLLKAYCGRTASSLLLELCLVRELCRRWLRRHVARIETEPAFAGSRKRVVDRYFRWLLLARVPELFAAPVSAIELRPARRFARRAQQATPSSARRR